jgi:hypothetical protein
VLAFSALSNHLGGEFPRFLGWKYLDFSCSPDNQPLGPGGTQGPIEQPLDCYPSSTISTSGTRVGFEQGSILDRGIRKFIGPELDSR